MRYVCYKTTVSKVIDDQVHDLDTIKAILTIFRDKELTCSIRTGVDPTLEFCRILNLEEDRFQFLAVRQFGTLKKYARYQDLEYLELKTEDEVIARLKPNVNRWTLLDVDGYNDPTTGE